MVSEQASPCSSLFTLLCRFGISELRIRWLAVDLACCVLQELWLIGIFFIQPLLFVGVIVTHLFTKYYWATITILLQSGVLWPCPRV